MNDPIEWVLTLDPLIMDLDARPMTQTPLIPNRARLWLTQRSLSGTCALGSAQPTGRSPSTTCAQGVPNTEAGVQASCVRRDVPSSEL